MKPLNFRRAILTRNGYLLIGHGDRGYDTQTTWTLTAAAVKALLVMYPERKALLTEYLYWENFGGRGEVGGDRIAAFSGVSAAKLREDIEVLQARAFVKDVAAKETSDD